MPYAIARGISGQACFSSRLLSGAATKIEGLEDEEDG